MIYNRSRRWIPRLAFIVSIVGYMSVEESRYHNGTLGFCYVRSWALNSVDILADDRGSQKRTYNKLRTKSLLLDLGHQVLFISSNVLAQYESILVQWTCQKICYAFCFTAKT